MKIYSILLLPLVFFLGCQTTDFMPPEAQTMVERVEVKVVDFHGRPDAYVNIQGRLSSNAAQLIDPKQSRGKGNIILLEVNEQTIRGGIATNMVPNPPFQKRFPLDIVGLVPGRIYVVDANGVKTHFVMPEGPSDGSTTSSASTGFEMSYR